MAGMKRTGSLGGGALVCGLLAALAGLGTGPTGHFTRSMFDRYNIVSENDLRIASQKTTMYVDTLPTKRSVQS